MSPWSLITRGMLAHSTEQKCITRHFHKCVTILHSFSLQLFQKFVNLLISPHDHTLFEQTTLWASTFHHLSPEKKAGSIHCKRQTRAASVQGKMTVNLNTSTKSMQNKTYHWNSVHHFTIVSIYPPFLAHPSSPSMFLLPFYSSPS
jgi:hypothetical protein